MIKTAKTVKSGNYKFTIKADGTCKKTKIETKTPDNSNSGKSDNTGENNNGKTDDTIPAHTHQWSPLAEDHTMLKDTNYVKHDAIVENIYTEIKPAWDEKIWEDKTVCLTCVWNKKPKEGEEWTDLDGDGVWTAPVEGWVYFPECVIDYEKHKKETGHTKPTETRVVTDIKHHPAEYDYVPTTITPEWSEWDEHRRCTVCGEEMTEHAVRVGFKTTYTPNKSGDLVNIYGNKYASVTAGVSYED